MAQATLEITADNSQFVAKMKETQALLAESFESMKGTVEGFAATFEKINVAMAAFTAVLAGGAAFKEAITSTVGAAVSASMLAREMGITATQASILRVAMDQQHVPMEAVEAAANKIATAIKKNPAEFNRMGVAIRESNGEMRNSLDIMLDVNAKLAQMKEGTARNVEGQRVYGKSWQEVAPSIRITEKAMEAAKEEAQELGLVIGQESIDATKKYRDAFVGVSAIFEGVERVIGTALLPVLTSLAEWFRGIGPQTITVTRIAITQLGEVMKQLQQVASALLNGMRSVFSAIGNSILALFGQGSAPVTAIEFFTNILKVISVAFITFGTVVKVAVEGVVEIVDIMAGGLVRLAATSTALFNALSGQGKWSEVAAAWDKGTKDMEDRAKQHESTMLKILMDGKDEADKVLMGDGGAAAPTVTPTAEKTGKNTIEADDAGKSRTGDWQTALEEKKVAFQKDAADRGQLLEFSKQQEVEYWQSILATAHVSLEERKQIRAKIAGDELAIEKSALEGKLAVLKDDEVAHGSSLTARLTSEVKYAEAVKSVYGAGSKEYSNAQKAITQTLEAEMKQRQEIERIQIQSSREIAKQEIDEAESIAKQKYDLEQISLSKLIDAERKAAAERYAIRKQELSEELALYAKDPVRYAQTQAQILQLATQHNQQMLKIDQQANQQEIALQKQLQATMTNGFAQAFESIIKGTATVHQAFTKMLDSVLQAVVTSIAKMLAQYLVAQATQLIINKAAALSNASVAATGAMASAAAIPYIGWALAPIEGASVYAGALAFAEKGYDVPAGVNPMTQLHQKEMVLPEQQAEVIRDMADGRRGSSNGGGLNVAVHAMDSRSVEKALMRNGSLQKAMKTLNRQMRR